MSGHLVEVSSQKGVRLQNIWIRDIVLARIGNLQSFLSLQWSYANKKLRPQVRKVKTGKENWQRN